MSSNIKIGQKVYVRDQSGVVRFCGKTQFAEGEWIGVELDSSPGRNDGSVNGIKYFACSKEGQFGIFVRPALVTLPETPSLPVTRDVEALVDRLQQKLKATLSDVESHRRKLDVMETSIAAKDARIEDLEASLETSAVDIEYIKAQNQSLERTLSELQNSYSLLKEEYHLACEELSINRQLEEEALAQAPSDLDPNEVAKLISQNKKLGEALNTLQKSTLANQTEIHEKDRAFKSIESEFQRLKTSYSTTKDALGRSEQAIKELQLQLETVSSLDELVEHLSSQNEILQEKVNELNVSVQELNELHEIDNALLLDSKETEEGLRCEIITLKNFINSSLKTIDELSSNNSTLKRELDKYRHKVGLGGEDRILPERFTLDESEYFKALLTSARSSRKDIVNDVIPVSLRLQIDTLLQVSDAIAESRALLDLFEMGLFNVKRIMHEVRKALADLAFLDISLKFNIVSDEQLFQISSNVEIVRSEIDFIKIKLSDSDTECINTASVLSSLSETKTLEVPIMKHHAAQRRCLLLISSEVDYCIELIKFVEAASAGRMCKELSNIYECLKLIDDSINHLSAQLDANDRREIEKPLINHTHDTFAIINKLWEVGIKIMEVQEGAMDDKYVQILEILDDFYASSQTDLMNSQNVFKSLERQLSGKVFSFEDVLQGNILSLSRSKSDSSHEDKIEQSSAMIVNTKKIRELELSIAILEENMTSANQKSAAETSAYKKAIYDLKHDYSELEKRYKVLVEENQNLEKQAREYLNLEALNIAGQQTRFFEDLASKKSYTEEVALVEEISFLRRMIREGLNLSPLDDKYDVSWLKQPIYSSPSRPKVPQFIVDAWNRRAYAVRMLDTRKSTKALGGHFIYLKYH